jgi:hypothetical protein
MATSSSVAPLVNYDAGLRNNVQLVKPRVTIIPVTYAKVAGNTAGDRIQLCRVHKSWALTSLKFANAALSGLNDANVGYWTDKPVGQDTDIDENAICDAIDLTSSLAWAEQAFEVRTLDKMGQQAWQDAGYSSYAAAPEWMRLALNIIAASTATGQIAARIEFALPS